MSDEQKNLLIATLVSASVILSIALSVYTRNNTLVFSFMGACALMISLVAIYIHKRR